MYQISSQNGFLVDITNASFSNALPLDSSGNVPFSVLIQSSGCIQFKFKRISSNNSLVEASSFYHTGGNVVMHVSVRSEFKGYEIINLSGGAIKVAITPVD